ncbi:hydroxylysine kinase-like [Periophthalmus magnuspinnatus]|uniref:hydroxylysine kinase-like n=1 Tax=Periophthalmus magnuspinnatus TaxID=409849 RepID=UPI00243735D1|nr:hydroxylysine kinase-like [Periophthalmus magnuspinnatus]
MDVQTEAMSFLERCGLPVQTAVHNTSGHLLSFEELVERYLSVMDGDPLQDIIREVFETLKSQVLPKLNSFPAGITHGDFSDQNILVTPVGNGHHRVSGVIDFTFLYIKCYVNEVAVTIAYMMLENVCPLSVGGAVLAGWESVMPLSEEERECIYLLVLGRLCQSLVYGQHNALQIPENRDYFLVTAKHGIQILTDLWEMGKKEVEQTWFRDAKTISKFWTKASCSLQLWTTSHQAHTGLMKAINKKCYDNCGPHTAVLERGAQSIGQTRFRAQSRGLSHRVNAAVKGADSPPVWEDEEGLGFHPPYLKCIMGYVQVKDE